MKNPEKLSGAPDRLRLRSRAGEGGFPLLPERLQGFAADLLELFDVFLLGGLVAGIPERLVRLEILVLAIGVDEEFDEGGRLGVSDCRSALGRADLSECQQLRQLDPVTLGFQLFYPLINRGLSAAETFQGPDAELLRDVDGETLVEQSRWAAERTHEDVRRLVVKSSFSSEL